MAPSLDAVIVDANEGSSGGYFQLTTLVADHHLDLEEIIDAQTELDVLGVYTARGPNGPLTELPSLAGRSLLVFELAEDANITGGNRLVLYPNFLSWGQAVHFDSTFARASKTDAMITITTNPRSVTTVAFYLQTFPAEENFEALLRPFTRLNRIELHLHPNLVRPRNSRFAH